MCTWALFLAGIHFNLTIFATVKSRFFDDEFSSDGASPLYLWKWCSSTQFIALNFEVFTVPLYYYFWESLGIPHNLRETLKHSLPISFLVIDWMLNKTTVELNTMPINYAVALLYAIYWWHITQLDHWSYYPYMPSSGGFE